MSHFFQKCCFESQKTRTVNECNRMSCCLNRKHKFDEYFHRCKNNEKLSERFYCLNRKQLGEYWHCVIEDRKSFCPEKCEQSDIRKELAEVFENLQETYFFTLNKANHQPVL